MYRNMSCLTKFSKNTNHVISTQYENILYINKSFTFILCKASWPEETKLKLFLEVYVDLLMCSTNSTFRFMIIFAVVFVVLNMRGMSQKLGVVGMRRVLSGPDPPLFQRCALPPHLLLHRHLLDQLVLGCKLL